MSKSFFIQNIASRISTFVLGLAVFVCIFSLSGGGFVYAQSGDAGTNIGSTIGTEVTELFKTEISPGEGTEEKPPSAIIDLVKQVVQISMYVAVIALIILFIFVAFTMITSQGNPEKLNEAKEIATNAITGFILIAMASTILYILANFINIEDYIDYQEADIVEERVGIVQDWE